LARNEFAAIVPPGVCVQSLDRIEVRQLFMGDGAQDEQVRRFFAGYDAIYSWFASQQPAFVEQLQKVANNRVLVFRFRPETNDSHQADYYLACLNCTVPDAPEPLVALRSEALCWRDGFCRDQGIGSEPLLIVAPGSGSREKNWPEAKFLQIVHWWREQYGGKTVVIVGPVEVERRGFELLSAASIIARDLDLAQLAVLLARGDLYIGNDSGVSHLAAAVGVRTVALFGPSDERQWAPRGPRVTILRHETASTVQSSSPVTAGMSPSGLAQLTPDEVIEELRKLPEIANLTRLGVGITV